MPISSSQKPHKQQQLVCLDFVAKLLQMFNHSGVTQGIWFNFV